MYPPSLALIPIRPAVRSDTATGLDVLVRITSPRSNPCPLRPAINLGLVLDNSGSMAGTKIDFARQAAIFTVNQLLATDRVSVTTFNSQVRTRVPNIHVTQKKSIIGQIEQVETGLKTALHPGWVEGSRQVLTHLIADGINRVVLLSDGLANKGETDPEVIARGVRERAMLGVSTTTMGVGDDFNEDLMESMARAGGGNYYYIESPDQLPMIFQAELEDMMMTAGSRVRLGFESRRGVTLSQVLNDLETDAAGRQMLPNLVEGKSIGVLVRLEVPPQAGAGELCRFCLEWEPPRRVGRPSLRTLMTSIFPQSRGPEPEELRGRQALTVPLTLPAVPSREWKELGEDPVVREQVVLIRVALDKRDAVRALGDGDVKRGRALLNRSRLSASSIVASPATQKELEDIAAIEADLERGEIDKVNKRAKHQSWSRLSSSSIIPSPFAEPD